jgi:hypothetical protein
MGVGILSAVDFQYNDGGDFTIKARWWTMTDITFEQVYELAKQLPSEEQVLLIKSLQSGWTSQPDYGSTREELLAEFERKKATGLFDANTSLRGKYAKPEIDMSTEELLTYLHEAATEWEKELDEFAGDD